MRHRNAALDVLATRLHTRANHVLVPQGPPSCLREPDSTHFQQRSIQQAGQSIPEAPSRRDSNFVRKRKTLTMPSACYEARRCRHRRGVLAAGQPASWRSSLGPRLLRRRADALHLGAQAQSRHQHHNECNVGSSLQRPSLATAQNPSELGHPLTKNELRRSTTTRSTERAQSFWPLTRPASKAAERLGSAKGPSPNRVQPDTFRTKTSSALASTARQTPSP